MLDTIEVHQCNFQARKSKIGQRKMSISIVILEITENSGIWLLNEWKSIRKAFFSWNQASDYQRIWKADDFRRINLHFQQPPLSWPIFISYTYLRKIFITEKWYSLSRGINHLKPNHLITSHNPSSSFGKLKSGLSVIFLYV
jgi:hypothetical protein